MKLKTKICVASILALATLNALAEKMLTCADVTVQPFVVRTPGTDRYHINLVFLTNAYKNISNVQINYKVEAGRWVQKPMQSTSSPWMYISNELILYRYQRLDYQFTYGIYGINSSQCRTNTYKYVHG
jgi:hypothetical protein